MQTVEAAASATVSVPTLSPVSPITLGDSVTASVIVGGVGGSPTGTITFQYSTDSGATWNALGATKKLAKGSATSDPYTPNAAGSNYRIRATYSGDAKYDSAIGNSASLTVKFNPTVPAPSFSPNLVVVNNAVAVSVTISGVSGVIPTGTATFQVKIGTGSWTNIGSAVPLSSGSASTIYVPLAVGSYQFQVIYSGDGNYNGATGSAVSVSVNFSSLDHFVFSSVGTQTAGASFSIIITAKDASNNTLTNYSGTNILNVSTGTINPTSTGAFSNGVWTGSVAVTGAGSGIWLYTTGSGISGASGIFTVNPDVLDYFTFSTINNQTTDSDFSITVTAKDVYGNTVTSYVGAPSLLYSAGSISPSVMSAFVGGVGSTSVTVTAAGSGVTITAVDGTRAGISNSFTVTLAPTPTPQSTQTPTSTPKPTAKPPAPTATPSPTPTPTSSPDLISKPITATASDGSTVYLNVYGNINGSDISNVAITADQTAAKTTMTLTLMGQNGANSFCNLTLPKDAIPYGTLPSVYLNNQIADDQGYTQDADNYYVWFNSYYSTYELSIVFKANSTVPLWAIGTVVIVSIVLVLAIIIPRLEIREKTKLFKR